MAAHTAIVTSEGTETIIRIPGPVRIPSGPVIVRENEETGELILSPSPDTPQPKTWSEFFDNLDHQVRDEHWDAFFKVMHDRPMNRPPVDRKLFAGEE
jgi:hypothetical protein